MHGCTAACFAHTNTGGGGRWEENNKQVNIFFPENIGKADWCEKGNSHTLIPC